MCFFTLCQIWTLPENIDTKRAKNDKKTNDLVILEVFFEKRSKRLRTLSTISVNHVARTI